MITLYQAKVPFVVLPWKALAGFVIAHCQKGLTVKTVYPFLQKICCKPIAPCGKLLILFASSSKHSSNVLIVEFL